MPRRTYKPMLLQRRSVTVLARALGMVLTSAMVLAAGASGEGTVPPPSSAQAPAPANDALANAQPVHSLPAAINGTTVGASTEPGERESACDVPTTNSVWYSLRLPAAHRVALDLAAAGALVGLP